MCVLMYQTFFVSIWSAEHRAGVVPVLVPYAPSRIPVQDSTPIPKSAAKSRTPASIELFHSCFGAGCEAGLFLLHILPPNGVLELDIIGRVPLNSFWNIGGPYDGKTRNRRGGPRCILFGGAKTWRIGCSC